MNQGTIINRYSSMKGISLTGFLFYVILVIFFVLLAIKLLPPYFENAQVKEALKLTAQEPNAARLGIDKIRSSIARKLDMNNVRGVTANELKFELVDKQRYMVMDYEHRIHMVYNIDCVLVFKNREPLK